MSRVIFHVDLNSFFASAETLQHPELSDKPMIVAYDSIRSVVSTANYKAREFGIRSGMSVAQAKKLCKELIIQEPHYTLYQQYSYHFIEILKRFSPMVEQVSIDEAFCDMTYVIPRYPKPLDLALAVQESVKTHCGLDCSIGIAPNKFLAKMASDMKKPRGITVLRKKDVPYKMWPLPIEEMQFIGKKTAPLLRSIGIKTIGDLANYQDLSALQKILGNTMQVTINHANGIGDDQLNSASDIQQLSQVYTLTVSLQNESEVKDSFKTIAQSLAKRCVSNDKMGYIVGITVRSDDFKTKTRQEKLTSPVYTSDDLYMHAMRLFESMESMYPIRLSGIFINQLVSLHTGTLQLNLFDKTIPQPMLINDLVETLNSQLTKGGKIELASKLKRNSKEEKDGRNN